jgi:hypothetical protein
MLGAMVGGSDLNGRKPKGPEPVQWFRPWQQHTYTLTAESENMAPKNMTQKVLDLAGKFVTAQDGKWNHAEWEDFLSEIAALGVVLNDESRRNLGNLLETSKFLHHLKEAPKPKGKAKPAKAKAKSKPKQKG